MDKIELKKNREMTFDLIAGIFILLMGFVNALIGNVSASTICFVIMITLGFKIASPYLHWDNQLLVICKKQQEEINDLRKKVEKIEEKNAGVR